MDTCFHPVSRVRMSGAMPLLPLYAFMAWIWPALPFTTQSEILLGTSVRITSRNSTTILYIVGTEVLQHALARVRGQFYIFVCFILLIFISIYLLTEIGLTPGGSSTVHIYTQTIAGDKQHRKLADFLRFRANTKMTPQSLLVNTCFTRRSLCIHAVKLTPSCGSHQIVFPNHAIRNYVKIPRSFIQVPHSFNP